MENKFVLFVSVVLLVLGMVAMAPQEASASLVDIVDYNFDGRTVEASAVAVNVIASIFDSSDGTIDFASGNPGEAISDNGWKTSGNYFYFSVTPVGGHGLNIAGLQFDDNKAATLGTNWQVTHLLGITESDAGTGLMHEGWSTSMNTVDLSTIVALQNITDTVTFRIAALGTSSDNKVWSLDNVTLTGEVTPEPATICLLGLGGLALLRKRSKA